jgi:hypothetical protein
MFSGQDAWRKHHLITGCSRNPLPGLGTALVIFAGYCVAEAGYKYVTGTSYFPFKFDIIFEDFSESYTSLDVEKPALSDSFFTVQHFHKVLQGPQ